MFLNAAASCDVLVKQEVLGRSSVVANTHCVERTHYISISLMGYAILRILKQCLPVFKQCLT